MTKSALRVAIVQETQAREIALGIAEDCRSQFLLHPFSSNKVCLFFHGFTATPAQFLPIGQAFFEAGYNVLIPLLPGHGLSGDWDSDRPPPLPEDQETYLTFGCTWLEKAHAFGDRVAVGGLSGGSTLAAWLALEQASLVHRALLFAPFLSNSNVLVDWFVRLFDIYFEWRTSPEVTHFGYDGFRMPALRVFMDMGAQVLKRAEECSAAPTLIVSSESDIAVDAHDHQVLFQSVLKHQPLSWYCCFSRQLDIHHNMMTQAEGNDYQDLVIALAKAYAECDLTWIELNEIRDRMAAGKTFATVVSQLNLDSRITPDLATVMNVMTYADYILLGSKG